MRLASLERLASGLRQAPHEYRPSLHVFADVSVDALARDLKVAERAKENGQLELPTSSSGSFDETEHAIIERIFSDRTAANHTLVDELETFTHRLTGLDFHGRFTMIENAAPAAVSEFRAEGLQGQDQLVRLRRTLVENEQEREDFKNRNRLRRAPRLSSPVTTLFEVTLLVFLFVSETIINGVFLAKGNALGFLGGAVEALVFAVLNVLISFAIGLGGLRQLNHRNLFRKFLGLLSLLAWIAFAILLNLALAHYREVSGALIDDAGAQVITRLWQMPVSLTDIRSWLFFGIGMVWSAFAIIGGIFYTDPFPGYAALERRVCNSHADYINCKNTLIDRLRDIRDDAARQMEEAQTDLGKRRGEHSDILTHRARIIQLFEQHQDQLERAGNALLSNYRRVNRQARSTPAPTRFDDHWRMGRVHPHSDLPEILVRSDLDEEIKKSKDLLRRENFSIHNEFEEAVKKYHQIDDLIPQRPCSSSREEPHAPTVKKSA
jgi:hypothetical protein